MSGESLFTHDSCVVPALRPSLFRLMFSRPAAPPSRPAPLCGGAHVLRFDYHVGPPPSRLAPAPAFAEAVRARHATVLVRGGDDFNNLFDNVYAAFGSPRRRRGHCRGLERTRPSSRRGPSTELRAAPVVCAWPRFLGSRPTNVVFAPSSSGRSSSCLSDSSPRRRWLLRFTFGPSSARSLFGHGTCSGPAWPRLRLRPL